MANLDNFMRALAGFGAGVQGQGTQFLEGLRAQDQRTALEKITPKLMAGEITPNEYLAKLSQYDPSIGGKYALAQLGLGTDKPAALQEWAAYEQMTPEQQKAFLNMKRATQTINLGGTQAVLSPTGGIQEQYAVTPKPAEMPAFQAEQTAAREAAKLQAEKEAAFPNIAARIDENLRTIQSALDAPGFGANFGLSGIVTNRPGSEAADAKSYIDQIGGAAFLTAIGELKGTGQITEKEGDAATAAVARLQKAQSEAAARKALDDLQRTLRNARDRAARGTSYEGATAADVFGTAIPQGGFAETLQGAPATAADPAAIDYREYFK